MKPLVIVGILLIVLGVGSLSYEGFTYTSREKIVDIGPLHASADTEKTVTLPPIVGGVALVCGVGLVLLGRRKK